MATAKPDGGKSREHLVQATALGATRLPPTVREAVVHPEAAPLQEIPHEDSVEVALSRVENLLGQGHYGAALHAAGAVTIGDSPLAREYQFLRQDKIARANLGIADAYVVRGDAARARKFFQHAIEVATSDPAVKGIADRAGRAFDALQRRRTALMQGLQESIRADRFDQWCGQKRDLSGLTILDEVHIREGVAPDYYLERVFGERPPVVPSPGYLDPLPLETEFIDLPSSVPASVFRSAAPAAPAAAADPRLRASVAMPLVANVLRARLGLFALDAGLNAAGQADGTVPLFRYEYLRDKARQTIAHIQQIESRMLPIQFELDDFAEVTSAIRRPLAEQEAELEAVKQRINDLVAQMTSLAQAKKAVDAVVIAFDPIVSECECDWWCFLLDMLVVIVDIAYIAAFIAVLNVSGLALGPAIATALGIGAGGVLLEVINIVVFSCSTVGEIAADYRAAQRGLQQSLNENQAELTHALATRDVLIARINALQDELSEAYQANAARVLDAKTLDLIQSQYNSIRQSLLTRAQAVAQLAQDAFNFERDTDLHLIRDAYQDRDRKDYTAAETLLRDLDGLDYVDVTGRTQKAMQLTHAVSLRKHYPLSFLTLRLTGGARFTTRLDEFDRWFPGTHQQRIKEVRVEVLLDGHPVPVRGYLANDGVSLVRFQDSGNKRQVDGVHVFAEPDGDIARLCYKRLQRRRHVDTMAFPDFTSYLHEDRMRKLQDRERNFFENVGLESTWIVELLPDQPLDLSSLTDVLIHFQYEALFDDNLKRLLQKKRYTGRREAVAIPIRQALAEEGQAVDLSDTVSFRAPVQRLETPGLARTIVNVGLVVKPKEAPHLEGPAELDVAYDGAAPVHVVTNDMGVVATAAEQPAGSGLAELEALAHGKSIDRVWSIKIATLPGGLNTDALEDVYLLLNYEYAS